MKISIQYYNKSAQVIRLHTEDIKYSERKNLYSKALANAPKDCVGCSIHFGFIIAEPANHSGK